MKGQPAPAFLPEKSHGQRSLAGYSRRVRHHSIHRAYTPLPGGFSYRRHIFTYMSACPIPKLRVSDGKKNVIFIFVSMESITVCVLVAQSCPTLCNPMDCSLPASSVHGILQARILEWVGVAIPFYRGVFPT